MVTVRWTPQLKYAILPAKFYSFVGRVGDTVVHEKLKWACAKPLSRPCSPPLSVSTYFDSAKFDSAFPFHVTQGGSGRTAADHFHAADDRYLEFFAFLSTVCLVRGDSPAIPWKLIADPGVCVCVRSLGSDG